MFYDEKWGKDIATIKCHEGSHTAVSLMIGFSMGFFFHPKYLSEKMDAFARNAATRLANLNEWEKWWLIRY